MCLSSAPQYGEQHPQFVVDQLDDHACGVEEKNEELESSNVHLTKLNSDMSTELASDKIKLGTLDEQLQKAQADNERLTAQGNAMRAEIEELKFKAAQEATGADLPEEEAATVAAAIGDVFSGGFGNDAAAANENDAESPKEVAALHEANVAALVASKSGASPTEVIEMAAEAHGRMKRAIEAGDKVRNDQLASNQPKEMADAAQKGMVDALKHGATMSAAQAACAAAVTAVRAGARRSEAAAAATAAAEVLDDLGEEKAAAAGLSAFHAVRNGYALTHALNAAEAVARTIRRYANDAEVKASAARAASLAAQEISWVAIIDSMKRDDVHVEPEIQKGSLPTTEQLKTTAKAISQAVGDARRAGYSKDGIAAAEKAAELVMRRGGTPSQAAAASCAAGQSAHLMGCQADAAAIGCIAAACTYSELTTRGGVATTDTITSKHVRSVISLSHGLNATALEGVEDSVCADAAVAAGVAAAVAYQDDALQFEAYRAGAAAAAEVVVMQEQNADVLTAASRAARKEAVKAGQPATTAFAGAAAARVCRGGGSALAGEAAAAAAAKACAGEGNDTPEVIEAAAKAAAEQAEAVITAAVRAAEMTGKPPEAAMRAAKLALECGASPVEAAAMSIGKGLDESSTALLACKGAAEGGAINLDDMDAMIEGLVAAATVATESTSNGATPQMAIKAGQSAAVGVANGATLDEVQNAARAAIPEIPGWSLESWLSSMHFDKLVSEAILKRVRDAVPKGHSIRAYEQAFVCKLGENGSVTTILALLKETPVLRLIAEAICGQATELVAELEAARAEAEKAAAREEKREQEQAARKARMLEAETNAKSAKRRWGRARSQAHGLSADTLSLDKVTETAKTSKLSAAEMNEAAKKKGAFTLAFSTDASLYWEGLNRVTGPPVDQMKDSIINAMIAEHLNSNDSDEFFEVGNYGTVTCSSIEWYFVTDPENGLEILGLEEWPGSEPERDLRSIRYAKSQADFMGDWESVNLRLVAIGEQPLSTPEFSSLRLYTGPIFRKYNAVLRAASGVKFLENQFKELCMGNFYATTLHVLTAAILKLGKITPADLVYRAPGGALPNSFWHKQMPECVQGGIELAFMSTTTAKEEAMAYARRAPGMILFEVVQGFVARGASISWLSQYPNEEEILFPPLTALEVSETRVEGALLIVQMRPSMKPPGSLRSGARDIEEAANARKRQEDAIEQQRRALEAERKKAAEAISLKQRQVHWQQSMADMRLAASRRQAAKMQTKVLEQKRESIGMQMMNAADRSQKRDLMAMLQASEQDLAAAASEVQAAEEKALVAQQAEQRALQAKIAAEMKIGAANWKLASMYGEAQFMKGLLRAKEVAALRQNTDGWEAPPPPEPVAEAAPPPPDDGKISHGALGDATVQECIQRFSKVVGTQEDWAKTEVRVEDVDFLHECMKKMITLCETSKKNRKLATSAGFFEEISKMMWRYEAHACLLIHCSEAVAAVVKKAESDGIQDQSQACMFKLVETMDLLHKPGIDAIKSITRNHRDNTLKLVRAGGLVKWLDEKSNVVPPDQPDMGKKKG